MAKVILHIGDKVNHRTYGEGIVTIVDDEFCTIRFETEELTFRLPSAFENGFLSSDDAIFLPDEEEEEWDEEDEDWDDNEEEDDDDDGEDESDSFEEPRLGFFSKLILGIAGARTIEEAERLFEDREQAREQHWQDTLNWQDAVHRNDPFNEGHCDEVW